MRNTFILGFFAVLLCFGAAPVQAQGPQDSVLIYWHQLYRPGGQSFLDSGHCEPCRGDSVELLYRKPEARVVNIGNDCRAMVLYATRFCDYRWDILIFGIFPTSMRCLSDTGVSAEYYWYDALSYSSVGRDMERIATMAIGNLLFENKMGLPPHRPRSSALWRVIMPKCWIIRPFTTGMDNTGSLIADSLFKCSFPVIYHDTVATDSGDVIWDNSLLMTWGAPAWYTLDSTQTNCCVNEIRVFMDECSQRKYLDVDIDSDPYYSKPYYANQYNGSCSWRNYTLASICRRRLMEEYFRSIYHAEF